MNLGSMKGTVLQSLLLYREARLPGRTFAADIPKRGISRCALNGGEIHCLRRLNREGSPERFSRS